MLASLLTSCSRDPFENSGRCETPGKSTTFDSRLAICTGIDSNFKWYHSGKFYDDTLLLAKTVYETYTATDLNTDTLREEKIKDLDIYGLYPQGLISIDDFAIFANGEARWDSLIESKSNYDSADETNTYLLARRWRLADEWRRGLVSRQEAFEAQEEHKDFLNGKFSRAQEEYDVKLKSLQASLKAKYQIVDKTLLLVFLVRHLKAQG